MDDELARIRALLNQPGIDIDALSKQLKISRSALYYIRGGRENIRLDTLQTLRAWAKGKRVQA